MKIYINDKFGCINTLDEFGNLLYQPLNKDGVQNIAADEWEIVDEREAESHEVGEYTRVVELLK